MLDLSILNEEQKQAVRHMEGPLAVIANPGSGKTRVIVFRILNLIEQGVEPDRIWACTFTKKSAKELTERLEKILGEKAHEINVTTLHSTSYSILKRFENSGYRKIKIVKSFDTWNFFKRLFEANPKWKLRDIKRVMGFISYQKLELRRPAEVEAHFEEYINNENLTFENSAELCLFESYKMYELWLRENKFVDFSDMLMRTYYHLVNPSHTDKVRTIINKFDYLLVDEAQDANKASFEIYKILGSKNNNIMFCGDPKQSIYSFQGSSYSYLYDFIKLGARLIELPLNYRSTKTIINHSNSLIQKDPFFKTSTTVTINDTGEPVLAFTSRDEMDESELIAEAVARLVMSGYKYSNIAILYRVNAQAIPISDSFTMNQIPFTINVKNSFYKRSEIKKVVAYIKILIDPNAGTLEDFMQIYSCPTRYIKAATMRDISSLDYDTYWEALTHSVDELTNWQQVKAVKSLINTIVEGAVAVQDMNTQQVLQYVLIHCGFESWLRTDTTASEENESNSDEDRSMNVEVLNSACMHRPVPLEFVAYAEGQAGIVNPIIIEDSVKLMSMHASKGLEFPVVIIAGACSRMMPYYRAEEEGNEDEERRVAYVGVTRAEKKLLISTIDGKYGRFKVTPSRYLSDMNIPVPAPSNGLNWSIN